MVSAIDSYVADPDRFYVLLWIQPRAQRSSCHCHLALLSRHCNGAVLVRSAGALAFVVTVALLLHALAIETGGCRPAPMLTASTC